MNYRKYVCIVINIISYVLADFKLVCPEESTNEKEPVIWPGTISSEKKVVSNPLCLTQSQELVTRVCNNGTWVPKYENIPACHKTQSSQTSKFCPPGYEPICDSSGKLQFCYQLTSAQSWNYPCLTSGSSETVYDLNNREFMLLLNKLVFTDRKLVWLPAKRIVPFGPIVWTMVGENWGELVDLKNTPYSRLPITHNCLLLDLDKFTVKTDNCSFQYPSICIFKDEHLIPLNCPSSYKSTIYGPNNGRCLGMEIKNEPTSWDQFVNTSCHQPWQMLNRLDNYLLEEVAKDYDYDLSKYCWTSLIKEKNEYEWYPNEDIQFVNWDTQNDFEQIPPLRGVVNEKYQWQMLNKSATLRCMACEVIAKKDDIDLVLQYSSESKKLVLTIYNPRSLWRKYISDAGVRCFTNAEGFVEVAEIKGKPMTRNNVLLRDMAFGNEEKGIPSPEVEKIVYEIKLLNDEPAQYWCEGHGATDFEYIETSKVFVPSRESDEHVFVLKLEIKNICSDLLTCNPDWSREVEKIRDILDAEEVRIMEVESIDSKGNVVILCHVSMDLIDHDACDGDTNCEIFHTYSNTNKLCAMVFFMIDRYNFLFLRSTQFCLPTTDDHMLHWELTPIGDVTAPKEFCMQSNGLPVTRQCNGSFLYGGKWNEVVGECSINYEPTNKTTYLYSIARGRTDIETASLFLTRDIVEILNDKDDLIPADIYFLSLSLKMILHMYDQNSSLIELGDTENIATVIDSIMNINSSYLNLAQTMNSSNVLLESLDLILSKIAHNESDLLLNFQDGIDLAITPLFVLIICNPTVSNITGMALARRGDTDSSLFTDMTIIPLHSNVTAKQVLSIEGLEIAAWIPHTVLNALESFQHHNNATGANKTVPNVIIDIFYNDVVFQETKLKKDIVNSRVISITLPGFDTNLPLPFPIIYRRLNENVTERRCAYWDFSSHHGSSMGEWSTKGCYFVASHGEFDICACFHLTHFAQLVLGYKENDGNSGEVIILEYHGRALNAITVVGCSLSLVGVAGIAATAMIFKAWRQKPGTKILLQLSAAIALQSIMMVLQDGWYESEIHCLILGVLLHYSVLAAFMWMLMTALLQFARYVKVLGTQRPVRFMVKFSLIGWGLPILPVAILLLVDYTAYLPVSGVASIIDHDPTAICYPQGLGLYLSVLLPVGCIVVTNLIVFVLVMRSVMVGPDGKRRADPEMVLSQLRLSVLLFFLLGLSWIFGLLAITGGRIIFSYLFCLTATLQGFVLFIYFVICDPATRVLWVSLVRERSTQSLKEVST